MVVLIEQQEFDTVALGIAMLLSVMTMEQDEAKRQEAAELIMKGLALIKAGVYA
jgi:hypothetical protein